MSENHVKPVLLLDFDGVLNSLAWIGGSSKNPSRKSHFDVMRGFVDPSLAAKVAGLVQDFNCKVIICSAWRISLSFDELREILSEHGIPLHGVTPPSGKDRTGEVAAYSSQLPRGAPWIVLDDSVAEEAFGGKRVVRPKDGLTDENIARARKLLSAQLTESL